MPELSDGNVPRDDEEQVVKAKLFMEWFSTSLRFVSRKDFISFIYILGRIEFGNDWNFRFKELF